MVLLFTHETQKGDHTVCHSMTPTNKGKFNPVLAHIYHIRLAYTHLWNNGDELSQAWLPEHHHDST